MFNGGLRYAPQNLTCMTIKIKKDGDGSFYAESQINFGMGGRARVSVDCDNHGYDEILLRREVESYLNEMASSQGMRVVRTTGDTASIPVRVNRGGSARVRYLEFPIDILP